MERQLTDDELLALKGLLFEKLQPMRELRDSMMTLKCVTGIKLSDEEMVRINRFCKLSGWTLQQYIDDVISHADIDALLSEARDRL